MMLTPYELSENPISEQFLPFRLNREIFAIESRYVTAVSGMLKISPLPGTPEYCRGIAKVEGKIIPVIDMSLKMCRTDSSSQDDRRIIIVSLDGVQSGFIVDTLVEGVPMSFGDSDEDRMDFPKDTGPYCKGCIEIGGNPAMILDCKKILMEDSIFDLAQLVS